MVRSYSFGLEALRKTAESQIKTSGDAMTAFLHWRLTTEGLLCFGEGETFSREADGEPTELLPDNWNAGRPVYVLRYRHFETGEKYVFKTVRITDSQITAVLMRVGDEKTSEINLDLENEIKEDLAFKAERELYDNVSKNWIEPLFPRREKKDADDKPRDEKPPPRRDPDDDPMREPYPDMPYPPRPGIPDFPQGPRRGQDPFFDVGEADLHGGRGGGMFMEPPGRRGGRGHLGQPRFDPLMPGGRGMMGGGPGGRSFGDAMRPPGFDDMFM